ncbi:MAG TPA: L,D-transpeptidase [Minicystis sp.]|nr:L,D-transpeptidase [Minicystis sp.]
MSPGRVLRLTLALALALAACAPAQDPPGRSADAARPDGRLPLPALEAAAASSAAADAPPPKEVFEPGHGFKIASIAMRTWVYVAPADHATKLGYLRAGAVLERGERSVGTDGCAGGWYRVAPRGYVCVGKGASLSLDHPVVQAAVRGPRRGAPLPYDYVTSSSPPPNLYFRLPSRKDQERVEGETLAAHLAKGGGAQFKDVPADPVPAFLAAGRDLPKPYGAEEKLHYSVHAGRAKEATVFGLVTTFEWTGRRFGLTTELDLIPLDRTKIAHPSGFHGLVVTADGTPAIVVQRGVRAFRKGPGGHLVDDKELDYRSGVVLTGHDDGSRGGLVETTDGLWVPADALVIAERRDDPLGYAESGKKWIDVNIRKQMLVAYEGRRAVFATLVSTGIGAMGDPETTHATVRGTFRIHAKHVSATMDGDQATDNYDLRDVPYIQYFHEGYALHGAFWHDDFGKPRSHGCVNLAPADAAWLFDWTDPVVPPEWHGAVNAEGGTLVWTHG